MKKGNIMRDVISSSQFNISFAVAKVVKLLDSASLLEIKKH